MRGGAGVLATGVALVALVGLATASGSPIVSAGLDQEVTLGDTVYLDGGGTHVPEGELQRIEWSIETPDDRTITPECVDCDQTSFEPNETGQYTVTLTAWSESGVERTDSLFVAVDEQIIERGESETSAGSQGASGGGGGGGCYVAHEGDSGDPMSQNICNNVGSVVDSELGESGDFIDSYTVEGGDLVSEYTGAERNPDGTWEVPATSLHHESDDIWEEHQEEQESSRNIGGNTSGNSGNSEGYYDPLENNSATDDNDDSGSLNNNPAADYTLPPNYR